MRCVIFLGLDSKMGNKLYMVIFLSLFFSAVHSEFVTEEFTIREESRQEDKPKADVQQKKPVSFSEHMPT